MRDLAQPKNPTSSPGVHLFLHQNRDKIVHGEHDRILMQAKTCLVARISLEVML